MIRTLTLGKCGFGEGAPNVKLGAEPLTCIIE